MCVFVCYAIRISGTYEIHNSKLDSTTIDNDKKQHAEETKQLNHNIQGIGDLKIHNIMTKLDSITTDKIRKE